MNVTIEKLKQEIIHMRATLNHLANKADQLSHPTIVHYSQLLDQKLNLYQKLIVKNERIAIKHVI